MKKYLVLASMFSNDLKKTYFDLVRLNEKEKNPFIILSPASMIGDEKDQFIQIIATAINMRNLIDEAASDGRPIIYLGPAIKEIQFDKVFTVQKAITMAQEKMVLALVEGSEAQEILMKFYLTEDSEANFKTVEEVFNHIKEIS